MRQARNVVAGMLVLAMAAGLCVAAPKKSFTGELRKAQAQMQRRQYDQVVKMCDALLKEYTEPHQVKQVALLKGEALILGEEYTRALSELGKYQKALAEDKDFQSRALLMAGQALHGQEKYAEAIAAYQKLIKEHADYADRAAEAMLRVGDIQCKDLKKPEEGLATYATVSKQFAAQPKMAAEAARRVAETLETIVKDPLKAAAAYDALATTYAAVYDDRTRSTYYDKAVELLRGAEKLPEATAMADKAEKALDDDTYKVSFAMKKVDLLMAQKKPAEARAEAERVICAYPTDQNTCQAAQTKVVEAYRAESKFAESLAAAKALYGVAGSDQHIKAAAQVVAAAFRSVDGNLGRANEFLQYQRFGPAGKDGKPGTPDDIKANHLAAVKQPADPARDKRYEAAIKALPDHYEGYRAKGFLYGYWGRPKECAQQFYLAFKSCPEGKVPSAATELVLIGMKSYTASFAGLDEIFEFISYGPTGKDGKQKIKDPFEGLSG